MFDFLSLKDFLLVASGLANLLLVSLVLSKTRDLKTVQVLVDRLQKNLDEMDEQAKLVVRTDLELNKAQEELDKKVISLYTLQQLSRSISTTLDENQLFSNISPGLLSDLGFEKAIACLWSDEDQAFSIRLNIGYPEEDSDVIRFFIKTDASGINAIIQKGNTVSTLTNVLAIKEKIASTFKTNSFVLSPLSPKEGTKGFFFVGMENPDIPITEGDEELITVLANQISQALDNARLFDHTWREHQELEKKVEQRTRELTIALEEVRATNKRKTDFVSAVSHELRTPLTSIKGYASILLDSTKLGDIPQTVRERLEKINRHSDELIHMINDLLDISRLDSGRMTMKLDSYFLKSIADSMAEFLSIQAKNKGLALEVNVSPDIRVFIDKNQIERVFINLMSNALKFTPEGGTITISAVPVPENPDFVLVGVHDTGLGIPPDALKRIFEEFYRVDNAVNQNVKGTGLGLSLVKSIIEAHHGKIWVESRVNHGSTFSFLLPIHQIGGEAKDSERN